MVYFTEVSQGSDIQKQVDAILVTEGDRSVLIYAAPVDAESGDETTILLHHVETTEKNARSSLRAISENAGGRPASGWDRPQFEQSSNRDDRFLRSSPATLSARITSVRRCHANQTERQSRGLLGETIELNVVHGRDLG